MPRIFQYFTNFRPDFFLVQKIPFGEHPCVASMLGTFGISVLVKEEGNCQNWDAMNGGFQDGVVARVGDEQSDIWMGYK